MFTFEQAKRIGVDACVDKLGKEFVQRNNSGSCVGYADVDEYAFCYVGINDRPRQDWNGETIVLDGNGSKFPYMVSCKVWYNDGNVEFMDCIVPT